MRPIALLAGCALFFVSGCSSCGGDETPPETIPFKELSAEPGNADVVPEESSDDEEDSDGDGDGDDATAAQPASPKPQPGAAPKPGPKGGGGSISDCCGSLNVAARVEKDAKQAARLRQATGVCNSINAMVKSGKTTRTSALRQVRAVAGSKAPASCR